jgi:T-complex protein 1 subunit gamma
MPHVLCRYFTFLTECKNPKACTILLRGASKDILNEVERNLQDAMNVARNVMVDARLVPGGGAVEMALAHVRSSALLSTPLNFGVVSGAE